jgi:hypothetical protein
MRLRQGIEDPELEEKIGGLRVGDCVKLTFLATINSSGETLTVRITQINSSAFRGKLADTPALPGLCRLRLDSAVAFRREHIHSVRKG